jgi:methylmalonyl-CoA mutase
VELRASINPIGGMAAAGGSAQSWSGMAPGFASLVGELAGQGFRGPFAVADGRIVHNAGSSEAQELAFAIGSAVAYLRTLEAHGTPLDQARGMIHFRLCADADEFLTIAKFRALRKLWARIEQACGLDPKPAHVSAETAWRMMTARDAYVNILRTTIAVFAAGIGGADAIGTFPHTAALGLPDPFARRIARNVQLLLLEESNLARVADPAAGSGAIEDLTSKLAAAAWALFQDHERAGGIGAALERGLVQEQIAAVRAARQQAVAQRKDALTGTSDYPDLAETPATVLDVKPKPAASNLPFAISFPPLPRIRLAEPFEKLRDASDRALAKTGKRPAIFLANLGTPAEFNTRSTFAKNFFEAGGIEAPGNDGFADDAAMTAAFKASGAKLACLCSSDEIYAGRAVAAAKALKSAGATHIYLAGRLREQDSLKAAGISSFIFVGCDVLAVLEEAHRLLAR